MSERLGRFGLPLAIAVALVADFPWGDFQGHSHWRNVSWIPFVSPPVRPLDTFLNFLLFMPMGLFASRLGDSRRGALARSAVIALVVSAIGEWTQVYSHTRIPSATDVTSNVAGALAGTAFALYGRKVPAWKAIFHLGLCVTWLAAAPASAWAQGPENVALVINDDSTASQRIGEYYARKRALPKNNVIHVKVPEGDTVDRAGYTERIERPIAQALTREGLQDRILYLVLTKGIPLRIVGTDGQSGTVASVDSELTLLYRRMTGQEVPIAGPVPNPYFLDAKSVRGAEPMTHRRHDVYLVTRLDAFTVAEALTLVDKALAPSREGKIVLDQKRTVIDRGGDAWLDAAATELAALGQGDRVVLESSRKVATDISPVLGYYSWGSNDPENRIRRLRMGFVAGSIAATFVSSDGRTFKEPPASWVTGDPKSPFAETPQSLIADLLREGATGAAGHVSEPLLGSTIRPQILFPAYLSGRNLAESFYLAMPHLSWQTVVVGDPLCAPFSQGALTQADIDGGTDPKTELPAFFGARRLSTMERVASRARPEVVVTLVRAEARLGRGDVTGAREALEEATAADPTLLGAELQLGVLYQQAKMFDAAADRFRRVLAAAPNNVVALNNLAYLLAVPGKSLDEAEPLARKALALAPSSGAVMDTLGWILHLKRQNKLALPLVTDAIRFAPKNAEIQLHGAIVYAAAGQPRLAVKALKEALLLDPALEPRQEVRELKQKLIAAGLWK